MRWLMRWVLVGVGWLLMAISLPLRAGELNGFMWWRGEMQTYYFLQWLMRLPRQVMQDRWGGISVQGQDVVWMVFALVGLALVAFAPVIVWRVRSAAGLMVVRCLAGSLALLPVTMVLPAEWRLPVAGPGLWLVAMAQVSIGVALVMGKAVDRGEGAFPVSV